MAKRQFLLRETVGRRLVIEDISRIDVGAP